MHCVYLVLMRLHCVVHAVYHYFGFRIVTSIQAIVLSLTDISAIQACVLSTCQVSYFRTINWIVVANSISCAAEQNLS